MEREIDKLRVDRTALSVISGYDTDDRNYWLSKSIEERLQAVELMRQIAYGYDPTTERLQRVLEIARR